MRVAFSSDRAACTVAPPAAPKARGRGRAWGGCMLCAGADRPAHDSRQTKPAAAAFLESWRGRLHYLINPLSIAALAYFIASLAVVVAIVS